MSKRRASDLEGSPDAPAAVEKKARPTNNNATTTSNSVTASPSPVAVDGADDHYDEEQKVAAADPNAIAPSPIVMCGHDKGPHLRVQENGLVVVGEKGYRMIRATHGIAEGAMYFEIKFLPSAPLRLSGKLTAPAVRVGVATADGDIQAPVGYDIHSFCYRSTSGAKVHNAQVSEHGDAYEVGDVVGVWLVLPPDAPTATAQTAAEREREEARKRRLALKKGKGAIDRIAQVLAAEKEKEELQQQVLDQAQEEAAAKLTDAELVQSRKFHKRSFIRFFKNGRPAVSSSSSSSPNAFADILRAKYFPAVSLYMGATVRLNFGPDFWCPPEQVIGGVAAAAQAQACATAAATATPDPANSNESTVTPSPSPSPSPSPPPASSPTPVTASPLPTPPFRHPLSRTLLTSGLFPHVDGSGTTLLPNPAQTAANAAAAEDARLRATIAAADLARKMASNNAQATGTNGTGSANATSTATTEPTANANTGARAVAKS